MVKTSWLKRVLIIEDEVAIRRFASRVLEMEGFNVLEADNGEQGLELARQHKCALVLLDLSLPGHDGWIVLERLKSVPKFSTIPVIIFTASAGIAQREKAFRMGAADYLVKPLSAAGLKKAVIRILHQSR